MNQELIRAVTSCLATNKIPWHSHYDCALPPFIDATGSIEGHGVVNDDGRITLKGFITAFYVNRTLKSVDEFVSGLVESLEKMTPEEICSMVFNEDSSITIDGVSYLVDELYYKEYQSDRYYIATLKTVPNGWDSVKVIEFLSDDKLC